MRLKYLFFFCIMVFSSTTYAQTQTSYIPTRVAPKDLGINSRATESIIYQIGSATSFRSYYGTESCTGSGSAGLVKILTGLPYIEYLYSAGSSTINFSGFTHVAVGGSDIPSASSVTGKIDAVAGTGTTNVFTDTTLAGQGTWTATFRTNGVDVSPTEVSMLDGATVPLNTAIGSITNHIHTGSDGTTQIAHNNVIGTGTNSHPTIDNFITSKASASGLASLDSNSLVVQNLASGTSTPGASKTVMSDGTSKINDGWLSNNITKLGTPTTDAIAEGSTNKYYADTRVNAAVGSLSVNTHSDSNINMANENDFVKIVGGQLVAGSSSATVAFSEVTGVPTGNAYILQEGTTTTSIVPAIKTTGAFDDNWLYESITLQGTTTDKGNTTHGIIWQDISLTGTSLSEYSSDGNIELLLHFNHGSDTTAITDYSTNLLMGTAGGNCKVSNVAIFSGNSLYSAGGADADRVTFLDSSAFTLGTQSFSIQARIRPTQTTVGTNQAIYTQSNPSATSIGLLLGNTKGLFFNGNNTTIISDSSFVFDTSGATTYVVEITRSGDDFYLFAGTQTSQINQIAHVVNTINITDVGQDVWLGALTGGGADYSFGGWMDEFYYSRGSVLHTGTWTDNVTAEFESKTVIKPALKIEDPQGIARIQIITGSSTVTPSYIYLNATTTVFSSGTNTAVTATATAYSGWFDGAVRATAFNVASTEKIKENIKDIKIKPDMLDAEGMAKHSYIANNKIAWIAVNEENYTTVVNETGTGSVIVVDTVTMESDYNNYIELEWAADLNQDMYTENIQKTYEKGFWQMFDSVTPRSWNPKDKPSLTRKGFVVEDMPDVVKGDDGQSIDPMALIAYISLVQQTLKADTIFALSTLKELITTGTVTQQKSDYCNDRLEVLIP